MHVRSGTAHMYRPIPLCLVAATTTGYCTTGKCIAPLLAFKAYS